MNINDKQDIYNTIYIPNNVITKHRPWDGRYFLPFSSGWKLAYYYKVSTLKYEHYNIQYPAKFEITIFPYTNQLILKRWEDRSTYPCPYDGVFNIPIKLEDYFIMEQFKDGFIPVGFNDVGINKITDRIFGLAAFY